MKVVSASSLLYVPAYDRSCAGVGLNDGGGSCRCGLGGAAVLVMAAPRDRAATACAYCVAAPDDTLQSTATEIA